ncbi:hypothetical protein, partial [Heyndrickxia coagulans]
GNTGSNPVRVILVTKLFRKMPEQLFFAFFLHLNPLYISQGAGTEKTQKQTAECNTPPFVFK